MMLKTEEEATAFYRGLVEEFRAKCEAKGVLCIVMDGKYGSQAAMDGKASHALWLPQVLRAMAKDLEQDAHRIQAEIRRRIDAGEDPADISREQREIYRDGVGLEPKESWQ
jgi:hypothetical protein